MTPLVIGTRPRFAGALGLMLIDLHAKARFELQLDAETAADFDADDQLALGRLLAEAADAGRPCSLLLTPDGHPEPFVALVSYDARLDGRGFVFDVRACRVCGCVDDDCRACTERTGRPCHWVEHDLCSACELRGGPGVAGL